MAVSAEASKSVDQLVEVAVAKEKVADKPVESPLPQIAVIHKVSLDGAGMGNEEIGNCRRLCNATSDLREK